MFGLPKRYKRTGNDIPCIKIPLQPMHEYIKPIAEQLSFLADETRAKGAKAYMKNQFEFLGIPMTERRIICKAHMKENEVETPDELHTIVKELWMMDAREYQYFAIELMSFYKKLWDEEIITLFEYCITNKSWWDTVDFIAAECTGPFFLRYPNQTKKITGRWNKSDNFWLQRSSLLFQKKYKQQTDTDLLVKYIVNLANSKEFFVRKAIGWILREYAKTDAEWVVNFVQQHQLSPLSKREALKHIAVKSND